MNIVMPHLGVSVDEGTVVAWHVAEGDTVAAGDAVCDIATDKVDTEVAAPAAGVVGRITVAVGETVAVGTALAELTADGTAPAPPRVAGKFDPVAAADEVVARNGRHSGPVVSPVARRLASAEGIDLGAVTGTGRSGRIRKADVLEAIATGATRAAVESPTPTRGVPRGYEHVPHEVVAISRRRRAMAEHMIRSRQTAAHMTTEADVDMSAVDAARRPLGLTALPFVARAACDVLGEFPDLNATFDGTDLIRWRSVNLGVAVDTPEGLIVPVIRDAHRLNAKALAEAIKAIATRARANELTPDDLAAGTFTLSNPGSFGGVSAMAIINQPQVAILGTPVVVRKPVAVDDAIAIRPILRLALTFDHRVIDGAYATRAVVRMKDHLEKGPTA